MIGVILKNSGYIKYPFLNFLYFLLGNKKLKSLKNKFKGETILVVGNGPSLKTTTLERFRIPSIGMNKIDLLYSNTNWRPNFIICINGLKLFFKAL